jgi:hypothetical protein
LITAWAEWGEPLPAMMLTTLVRNAGLRVRPMNRVDPRAGHLVGACPACAEADALRIRPNRASFDLTCACWSGKRDAFALFRLLVAAR